jgi:DNA-binding transcriptional LysR family regulator
VCCDLDLRALRCFLAVAEERHYGRAAARMNMSQPGLSRAISALERRLGAELVVTDSRPVGLTAQGYVLAVHARRLLDAQQDAFADLAAAVPSATSTFMVPAA